jgi:hypothetical protein
MNKKCAAAVLFLIIFLSGIAHAQISTSEENNIRKVIGEKTPSFLAKPIIATLDAIENFRIRGGISAEERKAEVIARLDDYSTKSNLWVRILRYLELYSLIFWSYLFNHQILYYVVIVIIILIILRYIGRLFFIL